MKPREVRRKVIIQARMRLDGGWRDVCIRDISSRGLLLQAATAPARGCYVEIFRASHIIIGRVIWSKERRFGVQTQDRMDIDSVVQPPASGTGNCRRSADRPASDIAPALQEPATVTIQQRIDRSRRLSALFQFGLILIGIGAAAVIAVGAVHDVLAAPMNRISAALLH